MVFANNGAFEIDMSSLKPNCAKGFHHAVASKSAVIVLLRDRPGTPQGCETAPPAAPCAYRRSLCKQRSMTVKAGLQRLGSTELTASPFAPLPPCNGLLQPS
jgi:hypothetical protein